MKIKQTLSILSYISILTICISALFCSCERDESDDFDSYGDHVLYTTDQYNNEIEIVDITNLYKEVYPGPTPVPVKHKRLESLPSKIKELVITNVKQYDTQVYSMTWQGETVYYIDIVGDSNTSLYRENGEITDEFIYKSSYIERIDATDIKCLLILQKRSVKKPGGQVDYLWGTWQSDWLHISYNNIEEELPWYENLPFSITEVCKFNQDGSGYLRTVKTYKSGRHVASLDPFTYKITNHSETDGTPVHFEYRCHFKNGDIIDYIARSKNSFSRSFDRWNSASYPWYKKESDPYSDISGKPKYSNPGRDKNNPIVGRWVSSQLGSVDTFGKSEQTFVFRSDSTGYYLRNQFLVYSFVYTTRIEGKSIDVKIYQYDTDIFYYGLWGMHLIYDFKNEKKLPDGFGFDFELDESGNSITLNHYHYLKDYNTYADLSFNRVK